MHQPTTAQMHAVQVLIDEPDHHSFAYTLTENGDLFALVNGEREYTIDRDGTVVDVQHRDRAAVG